MTVLRRILSRIVWQAVGKTSLMSLQLQSNRLVLEARGGGGGPGGLLREARGNHQRREGLQRLRPWRTAHGQAVRVTKRETGWQCLSRTSRPLDLRGSVTGMPPAPLNEARQIARKVCLERKCTVGAWASTLVLEDAATDLGRRAQRLLSSFGNMFGLSDGSLRCG